MQLSMHRCKNAMNQGVILSQKAINPYRWWIKVLSTIWLSIKISRFLQQKCSNIWIVTSNQICSENYKNDFFKEDEMK